MNIFVTSSDPWECARVLPDKHIVKMPLETCQMLAIVCSDKWGHNFGSLPKADGSAYATEKGAFRNHPCTKWANQFVTNWQWLLAHGLAMCDEYTARYGKDTTPFVFAGPDEFKYDTSIDIFTAYKMYIASKPWVKDNYLRIPSRKPDWI